MADCPDLHTIVVVEDQLPELQARPRQAILDIASFTGVGGENTDVLAHLTGFVMGALVGVLHAAWRVPRGRVAQFVAGVAALVVIAGAWAYAVA